MDADKIKQFFIFHGEKFVVGIVVLAAGWMVYSGLNMPNMLDEVQPERLTTDANTVRNSIDDDHNDNILPDRRPVFDILAETARKRSPVDSTAYKMPHLLERKTIDTSVRRKDPVVHAPLELRVDSHIASIAMLSRSGEYALKDLEGAEALEVVEEERPRPRSRRGRRGGMDGMGMEGMGMEGMGMEGMGMEGMGMEGDMYGAEMGMMGGGMGTMSATAAGRRFNAKHNFGFVPIAKDSMTPVPQYAWFISGTAVIPHKAMADSFREALKNADGYLPVRDQPLYFNYEVERADVTNKAVDELVDADWVLRYTREQNVKQAARVWAGYAEEVVPEDYRDLNVTAYIPPVLLMDYTEFVTHPLIPMVSRREEQMLAREESMKEEQFGVDDLELAGPGSSGMEGMGGMDMGMGADMGMQMDMGMGMGDMGSYGGMAMVEEDPVEYKLMRFYDFASDRDKNTPRPGRKYVYRVRLAVVDPNFPANALQQPKVSSLSGEVYQRVSKLMEAAEADKDRKGHFQRWSDWSEPSPEISLPTFNDYYFGPVEISRVKDLVVQGKEVEYFPDPPTAKAVNFSYNLQYKTAMPVWMESLRPGSVLSYEGPAELIDPIDLVVKKVEDAKITSETTVIDIDGGRTLPMTGESELEEPGMMLLFDENGSLKVTGEVEDQEMYRIYSFAEERGL